MPNATESPRWLGRLLYFTITEDTHVDHGEFCKLLLRNGIDTLLPPQPQPADVLSRVCTALTPKPPIAPGSKYSFRDGGSTPQSSARLLVEEHIDANHHTTTYIEAAWFVCRPNGTLEITIIDSASTSARELASEVERLFHERNNLLTAYALRTLIRKLLDDMDAILVRPSGGLYFVSEQHAERIQHIEQIINDLPNCVFHTIPLINNEKQRTMLERAFETDSINALDKLLSEMQTLIASNTRISSSRMVDFKSKHDRMLHKVTDYSSLVDAPMDQTMTRLGEIEDGLFELLGLVRT